MLILYFSSSNKLLKVEERIIKAEEWILFDQAKLDERYNLGSNLAFSKFYVNYNYAVI